jgi:polysaccharide export outer membrane protein/exopolysaccharide production protein ExoF
MYVNPGYPTTNRHGRIVVRQRAQCRRLLAIVLSLLFLIPWFHTASAETNNDYLLGMQDKVRVQVFEWRASLDQVFEWKALNSEYTVGTSGTVSLPLIGEVPAIGMNTVTLAQSISERLKTRIGLAGRLDVSVEVVQFRPFYIVGEVEKPGEYPFRPGLTVLRALSIAGGLQRATELSLTRSIAALGEIQLSALETNSLLARRSRLEAELRGTDEIEYPKALVERAHMTSIALLMKQEKLILEARREALDTQLQAHEQLKNYLEKEIESLTAQVQTLDKQAALFKREHEGVASLVSRGLAATSRQLELERAMASMEGDRLRLGTSLMKARQDISKTDISILELKNKRTTEITLELRQTQAKLEEVRQKQDTAEKLLHESQVSSARLFSQGSRGRRPEPTYTIIKWAEGEPQTIAATETTLVEPGDTVKVEFALADENVLGVQLEPSTDPLLRQNQRRVESASSARN